MLAVDFQTFFVEDREELPDLIGLQRDLRDAGVHTEDAEELDEERRAREKQLEKERSQMKRLRKRMKKH